MRGLLQFAHSPDGYAYRRTVAAGPRFVSPEGVVHAHGSLYLVSVDRGVISRLSLAGRVLAESLPFEHDGRFYVYWGMTRGPDGHLYLAAHESEGGSGIEDEQGDIVFSREMSSIAPNMGGRILLCDDLSDTGITFNKSIDWLKQYGPIKGKIDDIKTATLWKKQKSTFEPDFCAAKLDANPWIVQPFEIYEEIRIEDIKKKHQK